MTLSVLFPVPYVTRSLTTELISVIKNKNSKYRM